MAELGTFEFIDKQLIGGITQSTSGLMMEHSSMVMGLAAVSATIYVAWLPDAGGEALHADGRHDVGHHENGDHPVVCG